MLFNCFKLSTSTVIFLPFLFLIAEDTNFLIFDERMPRSLSFCNKEILSNLSYLQKAYKNKYDSFNIAKKTQNSLTSGIIRTVHNKKLYNFIKEYSENNDKLHFTITRDFNLV